MDYDFSKYNSIEDIEDIDILRTQLLLTIENNVTEPHEGIFIVGSFCFNIGKSSDIDIVYCVPEEYKHIKYPSTEGIGYDMVNKFAEYDILLTEKLKKPIQLIPNNYKYFYQNQFKKEGTLPPLFNLITLEWINKEHGEVFNKRWWNNEFIDRDA
jgi:hypothetical protein